MIRAIAFLIASGLAISAADSPKTAAPATGRKPATAARKPTSRPNPAQFEKIAKEAAEAREANRSNDAIALYRKALALNPAWKEGWWWLGVLHYDGDQYAPGRDAFAKFVKLDPNAGPGFALLGLCEYQTKDYEQALVHLEQARKLGLENNSQLTMVTAYHDAILLNRYEVFETAGSLLVELGRRMNCNQSVVEASGITALRLPILPSEIPPEKRDLVMKLGHAFCLAGDRRGPEAMKMFQELVVAFPNEVNVHYTFASFLLSSDPDLSVAEFLRTLELDPKHLPALVSLCAEYLKRGDSKSAITYARKAVEYGPNSFATRASLGKALVEDGQIDGGIKELELAAKLAPDSPQTRIALASAYAKAGRKEEAARERAEFMKLRKQMPQQQGDTPQ